MPLAACRLASSNVKVAEKAVEIEAETVKAAGVEVIQAVSVVAASAEEDASRRGER
jgi:hypothetical protein